MALITKAGGAVAAGDFIGSNLDYYTVVFNGGDLRLASAGGNANSQVALERAIEVISTRGQPVIMGVPSYGSSNTTFVFCIEHVGAWVAADLQTALLAGVNALLTSLSVTNLSSVTVSIASNVA
jgi:hypothetical protein